MKWYRKANGLTRRKQRKQQAEVAHECSICRGMHRYVRSSHGYLLKQVDEYNNGEKTLKWGSRDWLDRHIAELIAYERDIEQHNDRHKHLDEEMRLGTRYGFSKRVDE